MGLEVVSLRCISTSNVDELVASYIAAWSTVDDAERRRLIDKVYAEDAEFFADEPGDAAIRRQGRAEIRENITQVNERLTQANCLVTRSTGFVENHDLLRVSWKMTTPDGGVAMTGMNVLLRGGDGKVVRDYILIG